MTILWAKYPDRLDFVQQLWQSGLSTSKIAKQCSTAWDEEINKNAIVGVTHRHREWGERASPIRGKGAAARETCLPPGGNVPIVAAGQITLPSLACLAPAVAPEPVKLAPEPRPSPALAARDPAAPLYRRDGSGCLAVGCDGPLYSLSKPYCLRCANIYYARKRNHCDDVEVH